MAARRVRTTARVQVASDRGVFMISVAAELADMHPQTLRMYEARGLIEPQRSPKGTRLYSHKDVDRLRRIQEMTAELGMNLAGVERVFELEAQLEGIFTAEDTPRQQAALARLETVLALVEGWVCHVVDRACADRLPDASRLAETFRRRRATLARS